MSVIIPSWVEPNPAREVALDALGLSLQADQLADKLLPNLSVLTRRARYLSFLPWAVSKTSTAANPEREIHRLEAQLALHEAKLHDEDPKQCKGIVGRSVAQAYLRESGGNAPAQPEALYKSTAFRAYRPLLYAIHILEGKTRPTLTPEGKEIAAAYGSAARGRPACLSKISDTEKRLLRKALGFDLRVKTTLRGEGRRATLKELKRFGREEFHPGRVLPFYAARKQNTNNVAFLLHKAYVWEVLSLGLNLAFVCVLNDMKIAPFAARLKKARQGRPVVPPLTENFTVENDDAPDDAPRHVVALLRHACALRPSEIGLQKSAEDLAKCLLDDSPSAFLDKLIERHEVIKGGDAWVQRFGNNGTLRRLASPRKKLPDRAPVHPYRLSAFYELGEDLDLWL
jgi:hypothetical protein